MTFWTEADQAEADVLANATAFDYFEHRKQCDACQPCPELDAWKAHKAECRVCEGLAPLTYGWSCPYRDSFLEHNRSGCARCLPCRQLQAAIAEIVEWREARLLLSKAQALREAAA